MKKEIRVTWDIPEDENKDEWVVQFWMIEEGKEAILVGKVDKNSSNLGSLTIPLR